MIRCHKCGETMFQEDQASIGRWGRETFDESNPFQLFERLKGEVQELDAELSKLGQFDPSYMQPLGVRQELADCAIFLYRIAESLGINLNLEINNKMHVNRGRTWMRVQDANTVHWVKVWDAHL